MSASAFTPAAREAIYGRTDHRCAGCRTPSGLNAQHRRARGMGGSSNAGLGHPANGLALCGSGTTGCHGWTEANPAVAALLGWRLTPGEDPLEAPYYDAVLGWRRVLDDGSHAYVHDDELDRPLERGVAVMALGQHLAKVRRGA